ncbi:hypothetical protein PCANC_21949, partial [Puccinia coronata f. sp. avenae]
PRLNGPLTQEQRTINILSALNFQQLANELYQSMAILTIGVPSTTEPPEWLADVSRPQGQPDRRFHRRQLGPYLTDPDRTRILNNYLDKFNLAYIRIEDSLRLVLLSVRLPANPLATKCFLIEFGVVWTSSNPQVGLSAALVTRFIGFPNEIKTKAAFVKMIVQAEKALTAEGKPARANANDANKIEIFAEEEGGSQSSKLPSHILYQTPSDLITVKLPQPNSHFGIKLFGSGLSFEPLFLSFSHDLTHQQAPGPATEEQVCERIVYMQINDCEPQVNIPRPPTSHSTPPVVDPL